MSTFAEFITKLEARVENKNTRTTTYLQEATIRWLSELSNQRTLMMEDTFTFSTIAGTQEYDSSVAAGFPPDAMEIDTLFVQTGSGTSITNEEVPGPLTIREIRFGWDAAAQNTTLEGWCWHNQKLFLVPVPGSVLTVKGDYFKDATRDTATGSLITTSSTTHTNPWFSRGEQALLNAVLYDYYLGIAKDAEAAQMSQGLFTSALSVLKDDWLLKNARGVQAEWCFGG